MKTGALKHPPIGSIANNCNLFVTHDLRKRMALKSFVERKTAARGVAWLKACTEKTLRHYASKHVSSSSERNPLAPELELGDQGAGTDRFGERSQSVD